MRTLRGSLWLIAISALIWGIAGCERDADSTKGGDFTVSAFEISSPAFQDGERIPDRHTCVGEDLSPPLRWEGAPEGAQSFALIAEDPDAPGGTFVHWVLYNLPAAITELPEGLPRDERLESGALQGMSDFRVVGYRGPCPPPGRPHRYYFILRAFDAALNLGPGATKARLEAAMQGHVLAEAKLMGTYGRS
jgi:Raf kinase inhibitor-like YbhB/YbcL family protein